jgi:hypothetical protein
VLARLTDFQVWELYLKPAADRAAETDRRAKGRPADIPADDGGVPDKTAFVIAMLSTYGGTVEKYEADWERMKREADDAAAGTSGGRGDRPRGV